MEIDLTNEKQRVKAYAASLKNLNEPLSGNLELLKEGLSRNIGNVQQLTDLLARHGYTFGQPDSLKNNVKQRMADLMEDFRAKVGPGEEPQIVRATYASPYNEGGKTLTETEEVLLDELNDSKWDVVQINDIYKNIYKVVNLGWNDGVERWESESQSDALLRVGANSWDEACEKVRRMADNDEIILADRWDVEQVYQIEVTEELSTQVTVAADSRQEAIERVEEMIDNEELVLSSEDYVGVTIGSIESYLKSDPRDNNRFVKAGLDGEYTVRVSEFLQKTVEESGGSRKEAEERVFEAYQEQRIVLDEEDFVSREIEPASRITRNRLLEPESTKLEASQTEAEKQELEPSRKEQDTDTERRVVDNGLQNPDRDRVTDVSIMKGSAGKQFIRCKVDGEQQMAVPIKMKDQASLSLGMTTKEDLAVKYFHDELSRDRSQEQDRGLHR